MLIDKTTWSWGDDERRHSISEDCSDATRLLGRSLKFAGNAGDLRPEPVSHKLT